MKQLAEKLVMTADLLKYSPHSEITDVNWGFCVNICNLLSMPFFFYLPPIHSSLLQGHPLPESPEIFFPTRGLAPSHITMAFNYLSSSLPSPATAALAYFTSATGLPAFLQIHQACPYPRVLHWLYSDWKGLPPEGHWPPSLSCFKSLFKSHHLSASDLTTVFKIATLSSVHTPETIILLHDFYCSISSLFDNML